MIWWMRGNLFGVMGFLWAIQTGKKDTHIRNKEKEIVFHFGELMDMNGMEFGLTTLVRLKLRVSAKYQKQHQNQSQKTREILNKACTGKTNQIMVWEILLAWAKELAVSWKYCQNLTKYIPDVVLFCISSSNKDFTKVCKNYDAFHTI